VDTTKSARETFPFSLGYFFPSKNFSILSQAIVVGLATSLFSPLQDTPPIAVVDLLQAVAC